MSTSIRLIASCALLGLGLSGCYGETTTSEDGLEQTGLAQEEQQQAPEPDVIVDDAPLINVLNVTCLQPQDADGMDEPALVINGKKVWASAGFVSNTSEEISYEELAFGAAVVIEIWEEDVWDDYTDPNDLLGRIEIPAGEMGDGPQIAEIDAKGASYEVVYQVESCAGCSPGEPPPEL
jgi:hypothetical protein